MAHDGKAKVALEPRGGGGADRGRGESARLLAPLARVHAEYEAVCADGPAGGADAARLAKWLEGMEAEADPGRAAALCAELAAGGGPLRSFDEFYDWCGFSGRRRRRRRQGRRPVLGAQRPARPRLAQWWRTSLQLSQPLAVHTPRSRAFGGPSSCSSCFRAPPAYELSPNGCACFVSLFSNPAGHGRGGPLRRVMAGTGAWLIRVAAVASGG